MARIVPIDTGVEAEWRRLFRAYGEFYGRTLDDARLDVVWSWLHDPAHEVEGLLAVDGERVVGFAHFRRMPSPLRAEDLGFLDDLFVDPEARGRRIGEALLDELADIARQRGWPVIRWITADDNYRARALYDRMARKTMWNLYEQAVPATDA
jgi:ribosomal protein S18 acetylase RimI-like enzyme